jgi:hypothetical protein
MSRLPPVKKVFFVARARRDGNLWQGFYATRWASTFLGFPDAGPVELSEPQWRRETCQEALDAVFDFVSKNKQALADRLVEDRSRRVHVTVRKASCPKPP